MFFVRLFLRVAPGLLQADYRIEGSDDERNPQAHVIYVDGTAQRFGYSTCVHSALDLDPA